MSVPMESVSDILSNKEQAEVPSETGVVEKTETAPPAAGSETKADEKAPARGADGKFAKVEPEGEEPKADAKEPARPRGEVAALLDERRKRQAAEARLRELEGKQPAQPKPSVFDDEDKAISTRVDDGTRGLREQLYQQSVKIARLTYKEAFGDAETAFAEAAEHDDRLIAGLRASADPGDYIYTVGLQIKELADVGGDFMKYREKITADSRAQITERDTRIKSLEAQIADLTQKMTDLEHIPRSLNSRPSGAAPQAGSADPEDIKTIARFGNQSR